MKLKSFYINMRRRWYIIPELWNTFLNNLMDDYNNLKDEIDAHPINDMETLLQDKIDEHIIEEET